MTECPVCHGRFANEQELDQHHAMVHARRWYGPTTFSEAGDEEANGAIGPETMDTLSPRPRSADERARSMQDRV